MKKLLLVICLVVFAGCGNTPEQRTAWNRAWYEFNENLQREADRQANVAASINAGLQQRQNSYWQERRARQEYQDNFWRYKNWGNR